MEFETQYRFRLMNILDVDQVCAIEKNTFQDPWTEQSMRDEIQKNDLAYYGVLVDDAHPETVLAYGGFWMILDEGHITNIAVRSDFRHQGLGKMLMLSLMALAKTKGIVKMTLEVRISNTVAIHLYEQLGFCSVGIRKRYYADKEDAYIMWCDLEKEDHDGNQNTSN